MTGQEKVVSHSGDGFAADYDFQVLQDEIYVGPNQPRVPVSRHSGDHPGRPVDGKFLLLQMEDRHTLRLSFNGSNGFIALNDWIV